MPLELRARLSDPRVDAAAATESQRILCIEAVAVADASTALPLNLGLVLDKSGSMQGVALDCLKQAASHIVRSLSPRDRVAVVAFNEQPELLVSSRLVADPAGIEAAVQRLEAGGGTCIDGGMELGLRELRKVLAPRFLAEQGPGLASINRVFVLTDGHNQHGQDAQCVALARQAVKEHVTFSTFGIGEKFSVDVLRDVANAGNGMLHHVASPTHINEAFQKELASVQRIGATRVRLRVCLEPGVELGTRDPVCMVSPAIVVQDIEGGAGEFYVNLGDMPSDGPAVLLCTLYLPGWEAGTRAVATVDAVYEDASGASSVEPVAVAAEWVSPYVAAPDPDIQRHIARMAIYKQRQKAIALAVTNPDMARTMLQSATELAGQAGNEELRTVLEATLTELKRDGRISDKTMIQGEVVTRTVLQ
ncbi:MAG: VWA domain-containing protein [Candidatus Sericytochromatia bacterium]|nr:VWA domain-containing protein [Candidatus Tanganyikabacteria bacterium]